MRRDTKKDSFWLSYSDLMTSLFFIMLVLFITGVCILSSSDDTVSTLRRKLSDAETKIQLLEHSLKTLKEDYDRVSIEKREYEKLLQLTEQFKSLSASTSLRYDETQKTFIAKEFEGKEIFKQNKADIKKEYLGVVAKVGKDLESILQKLNNDNKDSKFLLVIEGNTANKYDKSIDKDSKSAYELSFERALALYEQWKKLNLREYNTEILICGSGMNGINRDQVIEDNNKRFVIQILPKLSRTDK